MAYFPLFINLKNQKCLVVGGGKVATRKVKMLLDFEAHVQVVGLSICDELKELAGNRSELSLEVKEFADEDLADCILVIAATDDNELNHHIADICKEKNIPINVVDKIEDCSFILPAYVKEKNVVAAFSSGGNSPVLTQYLKSQATNYMTEEIGSLNELLGSIRNEVKGMFATEQERKEVFQAILEYSVSNNTIPTEKEIEIIISRIKKKYEI